MTTKRHIENRISKLEEELHAEDNRYEIYTEGGLFYHGVEPEVTNALVAHGFIVEREERRLNNGWRNIFLHTKPSADEVFLSILWYYEGLTAPQEDVRIVWDEYRLEEELETADHPTVYEKPELPDEPKVVVEEDGWKAVAPAASVVENMVVERSTAEREGYDIHRSVPSAIRDAEQYDLWK